MTLTRRMKRRTLDWATRRRARRLGLQLIAFAGLLPAVMPTAATIAEAKQHAPAQQVAETQLSHAGTLLLLLAAQRVRGDAEAVGPYAHLAPDFDLPLQEDGTPMQYDTWTNTYIGTVFDTSWLTRDWLLAHAETVRTIKASGGDYLPTQIDTVLADAATANDRRVIVVDSGLTLTRPTVSAGGPRLRSKGTSYDDANWTVIVPSAFWDGTWVPTGERYPDLRPASAGGAEEQQYMYYFDNGPDDRTSGESGVLYRQAEHVYKYAFLGCYLRPNPNAIRMTAATSVLNIGGTPGGADGLIFKWSVVDCGHRIDKVNRTAFCCGRGVVYNGHRLAFENIVMMRAFYPGGENNLISQADGSRLKIKNAFLDSDSIAILTGGQNPTSLELCIRDVEIQRVFSVKGMHMNAASAEFGFDLVDGFQNASFDGAGANPIPNERFRWLGNKQHIEIKFGRRVLINAVLLDHSPPGAQTGAGITLQNTAQSLSQSNSRAHDYTLSNFAVWRCNNPFGISPYYAVNQALIPDPLRRVSVVNGVIHRLPRNERDDSSASLARRGMITWTTGPETDGVTGDPVVYGPFRMRYLTWQIAPGDPDSAGIHDWRFLQATTDAGLPITYDFELTSSLLGNRWTNDGLGGIRYLPSTSNEGVRLLEDMTSPKARFGWNGIPSNIPQRFARADCETRFPQQYEPAALWQPQGDNPWGWVAVGANVYEQDLRLAAGSPLKGLSEHGRDPGVDWAALQTAIAGLRPYPPEALGVGLYVDFVPPEE